MATQLYDIIELDGIELNCRDLEKDAPYINLEFVIDTNSELVEKLKTLVNETTITALIIKLKDGSDEKYMVQPDSFALAEKESRGFIRLAVIKPPKRSP